MRSPSLSTVERAIQHLLASDEPMQGLTLGITQTRRHDDTDGQTDPEHWLTIVRLSDAEIQVSVGEQPFVFRTTGPSPQVARALAVVAEALSRDNAARPKDDHRGTSALAGPLSDDLQRDLDVILEGAYFIPTLTANKGYRRWADDSAANQQAEGLFTVYIGPDSDVHLLARWPALRFRDYFGGGLSLRTRNALLLVAEAIRRDAQVTDQRV